jgi:hypothetical protein
VKESGNYVMIIANCDDDGLGIITLGNMEWKSVGGYLVSDMILCYIVFDSRSSNGSISRKCRLVETIFVFVCLHLNFLFCSPETCLA